VKKTNGKIQITIKDNGNGISQKSTGQNLSTFFTKPAGEGTGLDLSLSYDIIQAH
jgi:two-component system, NtrC family, sensor kinase